PTLLWCDLTNRFVWLTLLVTIGYGVVGFVDDYRKLTRSKKGISGRSKMAAQILIAAVAVGYLFWSHLYDADMKLRVALPLVDFYKHPLALWLPLYVTLALIVVVGASNGVNMTDGLDGLAIGPVIVSAATFLILAYGAGTVIKGFNIAE